MFAYWSVLKSWMMEILSLFTFCQHLLVICKRLIDLCLTCKMCVCVCVCVFIFKVFNTVRLEINIQRQNCHHHQVHKHPSLPHISSPPLFFKGQYTFQ